MTDEGPDGRVAPAGTDDVSGGVDPLPSSWAAAADLPHLALVETAAALPGLLPSVAWQALTTAARVVAIEPDAHPAVAGLRGAGITVEALEPAEPEPVVGRDLLAPTPTPRESLARAALAQARDHGDVALVLPPDDTDFAREVGIAATRDADVEVEWVFLVGAPRGLALLDLVTVIDRLLDPEDGCPWDLEQTHDSLAPHLVEETYEAVDAIASGDDAAMVEELGDVLMQVVFHARLAQQRRAFDIDAIAAGISDKLVRRHPHVFGDREVADADEVKANWEAIKASEKPERASPFDGVARSLPSLPLADKVLSRAASLGFAPDVADAGDHLAAAVGEAVALVDGLDATGLDDPEADVALSRALDDALGELALAFTSLARALGRDPDALLRGRVTALVDQFEAARRRADRRGAVPATTAQWQDLLDEVRAAGF